MKDEMVATWRCVDLAAVHCVQPGSPLRVIILLQRDAIVRLSKAQDNLIPLGERQNACLAMHFHRFN